MSQYSKVDNYAAQQVALGQEESPRPDTHETYGVLHAPFAHTDLGVGVMGRVSTDVHKRLNNNVTSLAAIAASLFFVVYGVMIWLESLATLNYFSPFAWMLFFVIGGFVAWVIITLHFGIYYGAVREASGMHWLHTFSFWAAYTLSYAFGAGKLIAFIVKYGDDVSILAPHVPIAFSIYADWMSVTNMLFIICFFATLFLFFYIYTMWNPETMQWRLTEQEVGIALTAVAAHRFPGKAATHTASRASLGRGGMSV